MSATPVPAIQPTAAPDRTSELQVRGMTCQNCVRHVREALQAVPGVAGVTIHLEAGLASLRWVPGNSPNVEAALAAVKNAGFEASPVAEGDVAQPKPPWRKGWTLNLVLGGPVTLLLMLGEWGFHWGMEGWFRWLGFLLSGLVQVVCGARFYAGAWRQWKARSSNMDTLVALGSTTAFTYSVWALFQGTHVFFMEAASIITLISVGHWLEARMSAQAATSMKKLLALAPAEARRRMPWGAEQVVPISALRVGDVVILKPGDRVPIDGEVVEGESSVDESMLTGESAPVDKTPGAKMYGGTANLNRRLLMKVTATGEATALAQIIAAVERAQTSRAHIQRLGDRVSNVFVPVVVLVAIATAALWALAPTAMTQLAESLARFLWPLSLPSGALAAAVIHCAAVLIIACPCAMGLATPAAIMAGTNAAAERGILIRDGLALEKAGTIDTIVFDKTGTLTLGQPKVTARHFFQDQPALLALARAMAAPSNHPLSQALARMEPSAPELAGENSPGLTDWEEQSGSGLLARWQQRPVRLGSLRWLSTVGVDVAKAQGFAEEWSKQGASLAALAVDMEIAAIFALQDPLKSGAKEMVQSLQRAGHRVHLLTGDHQRTAETTAQWLGLRPEQVTAEVRPEAKAQFVQSLQARGAKVAFVGDGINDAPALEQADLGLAVGRATEIAQMAADIVLLNSDVQAIPVALGLARATLRTIKQNLFWAFFYNALGIPLAALGFLSPILCAAAMGLSDVVVIGNALRLRWWKR